VDEKFNNLMKKYALIFLLLIAFLNGISQKKGQALIDSLTMCLSATGQDTIRARTYYQLALEYISLDPARAQQYADTGMQLSEKLNWSTGIALMNIVHGNILNDGGKGKDAIAAYNKAYAIGEQEGNRQIMATALNDLGGVYYQQSDFVNATSFYTKALKVGEASGDANAIATAYTNLSTVYYNQQDYARAMDYGSKALAKYQALNDPAKIARSFNYLGNVSFGQGDKHKTEEYYNKALTLYQQTGNKTGIAILYSQIAVLYDPDYAKIISYQEKSQAIWDSINPSHYNSIINLGNMGESYLNILRGDSLKRLPVMERLALMKKSEGYLNRAIGYARSADDKDNLSYFSGILAELQEVKGDYKDAIENYKLHYTIQDSLYSQENKNKIAGIESKREIDLRDKEIQLNKLALTAEKRQRMALIGGLALLLVIGGLLYFQGRTRKKTNTTLLQLNNELDEANKVKARFFAILSHDLRSPIANLVSFLELQTEAPGLLGEKESARHQRDIASAAHTLLENMEAMLLWSKGQMENFKPQMRLVPVKELFAYLKNFFSTTPGIRFSFSDPGEMSVSTDENYLKTIMHNLTANAVKALRNTPQAGIEWKAMQANGQMVLSITDNGPGIDQQQAAALYDDSVVANSKAGFGLHLIRDLAKAIQCKISMSSRPGGGTTVLLSAGK
jgi:signal transduction histidine kinase/Tfp pilus assembly protein PilF